MNSERYAAERRVSSESSPSTGLGLASPQSLSSKNFVRTRSGDGLSEFRANHHHGHPIQIVWFDAFKTDEDGVEPGCSYGICCLTDIGFYQGYYVEEHRGHRVGYFAIAEERDDVSLQYKCVHRIPEVNVLDINLLQVVDETETV